METEGSPRGRTGGRRRVRNLAEDKSSTCPAHGRFHPSADSHPLVDSCWTCSCRPTPTTRDWRPGPWQPAQAQAHAWKWKLVDSSAAVRQVPVCPHPLPSLPSASTPVRLALPLRVRGVAVAFLWWWPLARRAREPGAAKPHEQRLFPCCPWSR